MFIMSPKIVGSVRALKQNLVDILGAGSNRFQLDLSLNRTPLHMYN